MQGSRFTDEQIIGILQEADGGRRRLRCAGCTGTPSSSVSQEGARWTQRTQMELATSQSLTAMSALQLSPL